MSDYADPKYAIALEADDPEDSLIYTFADDALWAWLKDPELKAFSQAALKNGPFEPPVDVVWSSPIPGLDPATHRNTTCVGKSEIQRYKAKALCFLFTADGQLTFDEHPALTRVPVYDECQFEDEVAELVALLGDEFVYESDL